MAGSPLYGQALSFCSPATQGPATYSYSEICFDAEVLRYAIGAPLLIAHRAPLCVGRVSHCWTRPSGLYFSAELADDRAGHAAHEMLSGKVTQVSADLLFKVRPNGTVTEVRLIREISLTPTPCSAPTWARLGRFPDEPPRPAVWWSGAPPEPPWITVADRALLAETDRQYENVRRVVSAVADRSRAIGSIAARIGTR